MSRPLLCAALGALLLGPPLPAQNVEVESFTLDNGMEFLLLPRHEEPQVIAAGWVARVGSVNERPGITGISHFFEHMMFKGTTTVGTRDPERDREIIGELAELRDELRAWHLGRQTGRWRAGELDDPWDPVHDTPEMTALRQRMRELSDEQRALTVKEEYDQIYARFGGSGINAFTSEDLTFYFCTVPANKFELWCWMESDRLADSVFREFHAERDVVHEERRLRTESTPTGIYQEQFDSMFWLSSPYQWPVIGWPSDLNSYTREQAQEYFDVYYRPNNLVGVVVGDFDPAAVKGQIRRYFARLERGPEPPEVVTREVPQVAEMRMQAEGDLQPQVEVRYHAPPFGHPDTYALEMLAALANGRSGRLYGELVEGREVAASASCSTDFRRHAGAFSFSAECKGDATPEDLEQGWYAVLQGFQQEPVGERELQKVKNQSLADAYRRLQSNFFLLLQLAVNEAQGGWEAINEEPRRLQQVTAADVQRVANQYFAKENRSVALYRRAANAEPMDPELAALSPEARTIAQDIIGQLSAVPDPAQLQGILNQLESQIDQAPPEFQEGIRYALKKLRGGQTEDDR